MLATGTGCRIGPRSTDHGCSAGTKIGPSVHWPILLKILSKQKQTKQPNPSRRKFKDLSSKHNSTQQNSGIVKRKFFVLNCLLRHKPYERKREEEKKPIGT